MDVHMTKTTAQMIRMARAHVDGLRRHGCTRHARVIVVPERNLGSFAQDVSESLVQMIGVTVLSPVNEDVYGVRTLPGMREPYAFHLRSALRQRSITLHRDLVCENPLASANERREDRVKRTLAEFERQLRGFQCVVRMSNVPTARTSITFTGKVDRDKRASRRFRDDMVLTLMIGMFYSRRHIQEQDGSGGFAP